MHTYEIVTSSMAGVALGLVLLVLGIMFANARRSAVSGAALSGEKRHPCRKCVHFDYQAGQNALRQQEVFSQVMKHVPPHELGRRVTERKTGPGPDDVVVDITPSGPKTADWSEYGACTLHNEAVWAGYSCGDFVPVGLLHRRKKAMAS